MDQNKVDDETAGEKEKPNQGLHYNYGILLVLLGLFFYQSYQCAILTSDLVLGEAQTGSLEMIDADRDGDDLVYSIIVKPVDGPTFTTQLLWPILPQYFLKKNSKISIVKNHERYRLAETFYLLTNYAYIVLLLAGLFRFSREVFPRADKFLNRYSAYSLVLAVLLLAVSLVVLPSF